MDISIYRKVNDVREEVRAKNPKARWVAVDYRIDNKPIAAVGIDLELEYWKQSVAEGEVVLENDTLWFSNASDVDRFVDEFMPSIIERLKIQSFVKPFDDLYEFLQYSKANKSVTLESVVPVEWKDFFYSDEGEELSEGGVAVWFMLRAGCVGRMFFFADESSFAFENAADAILLAAYLTDAEKKYGDEIDSQEATEQVRPKKVRKKRAQKRIEETDAYLDYMRKMAEIMGQQEPDPNTVQPPWDMIKRWHKPMWGINPGNLSDFDLTSITIGDAYDPNDSATSYTPPEPPRRHPDLSPDLKPGPPTYRDVGRPWPAREDRYNMRKYLRSDPRVLRASAASLIREAPSLASELEKLGEVA